MRFAPRLASVAVAVIALALAVRSPHLSAQPASTNSPSPAPANPCLEKPYKAVINESKFDPVRYATTLPRSHFGICFPRYGWLQETENNAAAALSADGTTLAYSRGDGTIGLYKMPEGALVATLQGHHVSQALGDHSTSSEYIALSRNGEFVAAGGYSTEGFIDHWGVNRSVTRLWRRTNPQPLYTWNDVSPDAIAFSPDASQLAVFSPAGVTDSPQKVWLVSVRTKTVRAWTVYTSFTDMGTGKCIPEVWEPATFATSSLSLVDIGPPCKKTGKQPAAFAYEGTSPSAPDEQAQGARYLRLWPFDSAMPKAAFAGPTFGQDDRPVVTLSADGKTIFTATAQHFAIWDVAKAKLKAAGPAAACGTVVSLYAVSRYVVGLCVSEKLGYRLAFWDVADAHNIFTTETRLSDLTGWTTQVMADEHHIYVTVPAGIDVWNVSL